MCELPSLEAGQQQSITGDTLPGFVTACNCYPMWLQTSSWLLPHIWIDRLKEPQASYAQYQHTLGVIVALNTICSTVSISAKEFAITQRHVALYMHISSHDLDTQMQLSVTVDRFRSPSVPPDLAEQSCITSDGPISWLAYLYRLYQQHDLTAGSGFTLPNCSRLQHCTCTSIADSGCDHLIELFLGVNGIHASILNAG